MPVIVEFQMSRLLANHVQCIITADKPVCPKPDVLETTKLEEVTCECGEGYFRPDGAWVSGADVRSGKAPPKELPNFQGQVRQIATPIFEHCTLTTSQLAINPRRTELGPRYHLRIRVFFGRTRLA